MNPAPPPNTARFTPLLGLATALLTIFGLLAALFPVTASASHTGTEGTIKLDSIDIGSVDPDENDENNQPMLDCIFEIEAFGYQSTAPATLDFLATWTITVRPPTSPPNNSIAGTLDIDGDAGPGSDFDGTTGPINLGSLLSGYGLPSAKGYHVKVEVDVPDMHGGSKKKTVWVNSCAATLNIDKVTAPDSNDTSRNFDFTVEETPDTTSFPQSVNDLTGPGAAGAPAVPITTGHTYTVTEEDLTGTGWSLTSASCSDGNVATSDGTFSGRSISGIQVAAGATINCTFTNTKAAAAPTWSISGTKTEDADRDGTTAGDSLKSGWTIKLVADDGDGILDGGDTVTTTTTDLNGDYSFTGLTDGADYLVCEESGGVGWTQLAPTTGATCTAVGNATNGYDFQTLSADQSGKDFWNQPPAPPPAPTWSISGTKTEDADRDGTTAGDSLKSGWTIKLVADDGDGILDGGDTVTTTTTDLNGDYSFTGLTDGADYLVCEESGGVGWTQLAPTTGATCTAVGNATNGYDFQTLSADQSGKDFWNQPPAPLIPQGPPPPPPVLPDLKITKTGLPGSVPVGSDVTYTLTVTNKSTVDAPNAVVTDILPMGLQFVSSTPGAPTCTNSHNALTTVDTLTCQLGTIAAGATSTVTVVAKGLAPGTYTNIATVGPTDATPLDNTDDEVTEVTPIADLEVTKTAQPTQVTVGQNITYTITTTNHGPNTAVGVTVTDTLPSQVTFVSASVPCTGTTTITCSLGDMLAGETKIITVVAHAHTVGVAHNAVSVISTIADPDLSNNNDEVDVPIDEVLAGVITDPSRPGPDKVLGERVTRSPAKLLPFTGSDPRIHVMVGVWMLLLGLGCLALTNRHIPAHGARRRLLRRGGGAS